MKKNYNPMPAMVESALRGFLGSKLAADARLNLKPLVKGVTVATWAADKPKLKLALDAAVQGKLAKDADVDGLMEVLDSIEDVKDDLAEVIAEANPASGVDDEDAMDGADDLCDQVSALLTGKVSAEVLAAVMAALKPIDAVEPLAATDDKDADPKETPKMQPATITKAAMDAALKLAKAETEASTIKRLRGIQEAERAVRPFIGSIEIAQDSAAAVYKMALDAQAIDLTDVPEAAYSAMVKMLRKPGEALPAGRVVAMDAASDADFHKRFPGASSLKSR